MRAVAVILVILCLAAFAGIAYLYISSGVLVTGTGCIAADAVHQQEYFDSLKTSLRNETFSGTVFSAEDIGNPDQYQFYSYTVRLKNNTFLNAEAVELTVSPMNGDILQIGDTEMHTLRAQTSGDITAMILTAKGMHNVRELTVSWYFWGLPFSVRFPYDGH